MAKAVIFPKSKYPENVFYFFSGEVFTELLLCADTVSFEGGHSVVRKKDARKPIRQSVL